MTVKTKVILFSRQGVFHSTQQHAVTLCGKLFQTIQPTAHHPPNHMNSSQSHSLMKWRQKKDQQLSHRKN